MLGFSNWRSLERLAVGDLPKYGDIQAVYAMRSKHGALLYIGSTGNLRRRIFGNYLGGVGGETTKRVNRLLFSAGAVADIEVAWIETVVYREKERELKELCRDQLGGLPHWTKL